MRVLVCGGRHYTDKARLFSELDRLHREHLFTGVICGGALGADTLGAKWAAQRDIRCVTYMAPWKQLGRAAGTHRNRTMLYEGKPDLVVAFPGGRGTAHMVGIAKAAGVRTIEIEAPPLDNTPPAGAPLSPPD